MQAGQLDKRVTFMRRERVPGKSADRGPFAELLRVACAFRPVSGRALAEAGSLTDAIEGSICVRDTARTRGLTVADRAVIDGRDMAIESVQPSDRSGWLWIKVSRRKASA